MTKQTTQIMKRTKQENNNETNHNLSTMIRYKKIDKHPERAHTAWDKKFYLYKKGGIEHRSARHNQETNQYWNYIKVCSRSEIQASIRNIKQEMKSLDKNSPTYQEDLKTKRTKFTIACETYELFTFTESTEKTPTNIILEGIDGKPVDVILNPPSTQKSDYTGFIGASGYITTKGAKTGEVGLFIRSRDKGRAFLIKLLSNWHNIGDYPNPSLVEQKAFELEQEIESRESEPNLRNIYWKWRYDKNLDKNPSDRKKRPN